MKKLYILLFTFFIALASFGQEFFSYSFEDNGNGTIYNTSVPEFSDLGVSSGYDFFTSTFNNAIGSGYGVSGQDGTHYFAAQDLDGEGGPTTTTLTLDIDITGRSSLGLKILIAEDDFGDPKWDDSDYFHIDYSIDGGTTQNFLWIEAQGGTNSETLVDTNFDGVGDGITIPETFLEFENALTGTGTTLTLTFTFNFDAGNEDIAIDNIRVFEGFVTSPTILAGGSVTDLNYIVGSGPSSEGSFTVSGTDLTDDITIAVPTNFEISETSGSGFVDTNIVLDGSSGTVPNTTIYARLKSGLTVNNYSGDVNLTSSGADAKTVTLSGEVLNPPPSLPFYEGFDYTVSEALTNQTNWSTLNSGDDILVSGPGGLTYTGLASDSQTGNHVSFDGSGAEAKLEFSPVSSGEVFASFIINISDQSAITDLTDGGYIAALAESDSSYDARVWVHPDTDPVGTTYDISLTNASSGGPFSGPFNIGDNVLIVISYDLGTGNIFGWLNPTLPGGPGNFPEFTLTDASPASAIDRFILRQDTTGETPSILFDELRIGTSWTDVTPATLAVAEVDTNNFKIYPNPSNKGFVNITSLSSEVIKANVFDILGKKVLEGKVENNQLNVSNLNAGMYILKLSQNNATVSKKLLIQ